MFCVSYLLAILTINLVKEVNVIILILQKTLAGREWFASGHLSEFKAEVRLQPREASICGSDSYPSCCISDEAALLISRVRVEAGNLVM